MMKRSIAGKLSLISLVTAACPALFAASGGPVTIAWETPPRTIDPRFATDADSQYLENLTHCALVGFDQNGGTIGDLAESWKWTSPKVLTVKLKKNANFSDGTPVKASDIEATYSFLTSKDSKTPSPRAGAFAGVESVKASGPDTVTFALKDPDATFVTNLVVGILPASIAGAEMITDISKMIGCGPFRIKAQDTNGIDLEANKHYSLGKAPKASQITIKIVRDESTRFSKLQKGEVDLVQNLINRDQLSSIAKTSPNLKVVRRAGLNTTYLGFNMRNPTLANPKVRQAISHAIDRKVIITHALNGLAVPAVTMLPASDPYTDSTLTQITHDQAMANKLLDEAELKSPGKGQPRFKISYKTTNNITRVTIAKAIASQLKKVGIEVTVEPLEWGRFKADVEAGRVEMWSLSWVGFKDPDIYRFAFATESFPPNGGNRGWYSNPNLDKLLTEARTVNDPEKRKDLYSQVQKIVAGELPYVFLWHEEIFAVHNRNLQGFELYADGRYESLKQTFKP